MDPFEDDWWCCNCDDGPLSLSDSFCPTIGCGHTLCPICPTGSLGGSGDSFRPYAPSPYGETLGESGRSSPERAEPTSLKESKKSSVNKPINKNKTTEGTRRSARRNSAEESDVTDESTESLDDKKVGKTSSLGKDAVPTTSIDAQNWKEKAPLVNEKPEEKPVVSKQQVGFSDNDNIEHATSQYPAFVMPPSIEPSKENIIQSNELFKSIKSFIDQDRTFFQRFFSQRHLFCGLILLRVWNIWFHDLPPFPTSLSLLKFLPFLKGFVGEYAKSTALLLSAFISQEMYFVVFDPFGICHMSTWNVLLMDLFQLTIYTTYLLLDHLRANQRYDCRNSEASKQRRFRKSKGRFRVSWKCECGHIGTDEFVLTRNTPGGLLDDILQSFDHIAEVLAIQRGDHTKFLHRTYQRVGIYINSAVVSANQACRKVARFFSDLGSPSQTTTHNPVNSNSVGSELYLLLCLPGDDYPLTLHHLDIRNVLSDGQLFRMLKQHYSSSKGLGFWRLKKLKDIRFVKFRIARRQQIEGILGFNVLPPSENRSYLFDPRICEDPPPIAPSLLLHRFHHQEMGDGCLDYYRRIPKKCDGRLEFDNNVEKDIGWGLKFVEGPHWGKTSTGVLLSVFLGGLLFSVLFGYYEKDFAVAFTASGYISTCFAASLVVWQIWASCEAHDPDWRPL